MALLLRKLFAHVLKSSQKTLSQYTKSTTSVDREAVFLPALFASINKHVNTENSSKGSLKEVYTESNCKLSKLRKSYSLDKGVKNLVIIERKDTTLCIFPEAQAKFGLLKEDGQLQNVISFKHAREIEKSLESIYKDISRHYGHGNTLPQSLEFLNNGILYFSNKPMKKQKITDDEYFGKPSEADLENVRNVLGNTLPKFFRAPLDYSIINPEIIFDNNIWRHQSKGIGMYSLQLLLVRTLANLVYVQVSMQILKITTHPDQGTVKVRWRIVGLPQTAIYRIFRYAPGKYRESVKTDSKWTDGLSTYYIGGDGKAYRHVVDNVIPDDEVPNLTEIIDKKTAPVGFMSKTEVQSYVDTVLEQQNCLPS